MSAKKKKKSAAAPAAAATSASSSSATSSPASTAASTSSSSSSTTTASSSSSASASASAAAAAVSNTSSSSAGKTDKTTAAAGSNVGGSDASSFVFTEFSFQGKKKKQKISFADLDLNTIDFEGVLALAPPSASTSSTPVSTPASSSTTISKGKEKAAIQPTGEKTKTGDGEDGEDEDDGDDGDDEMIYNEGDDGDNAGVSFEDGDDGNLAGGSGNGAGPDPWIGSDRDYEYMELLGRFYQLLHGNNPEMMRERQRFVIKPPQVSREGIRRTIWHNFQLICTQMRRTPEHVLSFVLAELGTEGNLDPSQRLLIKGRFQPKQIETILRRYITEYVTCSMCKSPQTQLIRRADTRLYFVKCNSCESQRSVALVKTGFQAQIGKRKKV